MKTTSLELARQLLDALAPARHGPGYGSVLWYGTYHTFTGAQAKIVGMLWEAWLNGTPDVRQETLLEAAGSEGSKVANLFRQHAAWGTMIVAGQLKGLYRLAEPTVAATAPEAPQK